MRASRTIVAVGTVLLVAAANAPAQAGGKVSGTLSKSGYTVLAVSTAGKSITSKSTGRAFSIVAPGPAMTLHLITKSGRYAGPVVVSYVMKGKDKKHQKKVKAVLGVKAGAKLGKIQVKSGFAATKKAPARRYLLPARTSRLTRSGAPVGAPGFGLVASTATSSQVAQRHWSDVEAADLATQPNVSISGQDPDKDGLVNAVDIDANGNGVIDSVDPAAPPASGIRSFVNYFADPNTTVNVDADPTSGARIDSTMQALLELVFLDIPVDAELNCLGLSWCSPGGTGQIAPAGGGPGPSNTVAFPACCTDPATGFGRIYHTSQSAGSGNEFRIWPRATSANIATGDTLVMNVPQADGSFREVPGAVGFVFNTVPAVKSWSDTAQTTTIAYPSHQGDPGNQGNPFVLDPAHPQVTLTYWRPQRPSLAGAGEPAGYMDIGGLKYDVQAMFGGGGGSGGGAPQCGPGALSTTDPNLVLSSTGVGQILTDTQPDRAADAANTLSFTVDLAQCAANKGVSLTPGTTLNLGLEAFSPAPNTSDHVVQSLMFRVG